MLTRIHLLLWSFISIIFAPSLCLSSPTEQGSRAYRGVIVCGGNHFTRLNNTELHTTSYVWRNYDPKVAIRIKRVLIFNAHGVLLKNYPGMNLPLARNGVMGNSDDTIEPLQSALYRTNELLDGLLTRKERPIQVWIYWEAVNNAARSRALIPEFVWVRTSRRQVQVGIDASGAPIYKVKEERARHLNNCRLVKADSLK